MKLRLMTAWIGGLWFLAALPAWGQSAGTSQTVLILATGASQMNNGKPTGLWLEEFAVPYQAFVNAGYRVEVATPRGGDIPVDPRSAPTPEQTKAWAPAIAATKSVQSLGSVSLDRVDAIFVPGGHGAMFDLATDLRTAQVISELFARDKIVAAVCHGPAALVKATLPDGRPLVNGRRISAFTDSEEAAVELTRDMPFLLETRLRELGAVVDKAKDFQSHAVRDGNLITGQNPPSSEQVARLVIRALQEKSETTR